MDFDDQLRRYFGSADTSTLARDALEAGTKRVLVYLGLEPDQARGGLEPLPVPIIF
jgi:hypothetical protein